jgi:hypothetical protein
MTGSSVRLVGARELPTLGGLLLASSGATDPTMVLHHIDYTGQIRGAVIVGSVRRWRDRQAASAMDLAEQPQVIMILSDDLSEIRVMENPTKRSPSVYAMSRS